ncbi:hypothetical protein E2562_028098 [Oryza meyeriana var. granulata]|uniref:Uncharacterized protein n=1 Tax=Oryza meyeriana var. granulata TaxID=110450 RepID=A0A6G1C9F8_9ORYZ|nr:hypothetical protein E2562_028098 [Oryza meyeriana var. granulata]
MCATGEDALPPPRRMRSRCATMRSAGKGRVGKPPAQPGKVGRPSGFEEAATPPLAPPVGRPMRPIRAAVDSKGRRRGHCPEQQGRLRAA